jgi:hypothetical protein
MGRFRGKRQGLHRIDDPQISVSTDDLVDATGGIASEQAKVPARVALFPKVKLDLLVLPFFETHQLRGHF